MRLQVNINIDGAFTLSVVDQDPSILPPWAGSLRVNETSLPIFFSIGGFIYLIASGLVGEPTAPVIGRAGATKRNSYCLSAAQSLDSSSR